MPKQRTAAMRDATERLIRVGMDSGAVDLVVAAYRGNPELLEVLLASSVTRQETTYIAMRAGDESSVNSLGWSRSPKPIQSRLFHRANAKCTS